MRYNLFINFEVIFMKRFFALALILCMAFSLCTLSGCKEKDYEKNIYADLEEFDSYVPRGSEIIGTWAMTSPQNDMEWHFFANTTLHMTKIDGDIRTSSICTYNYDGEGLLKVYVFNGEEEYDYTVELKGKTLSLTDSEGVVSTFTKI